MTRQYRSTGANPGSQSETAKEQDYLIGECTMEESKVKKLTWETEEKIQNLFPHLVGGMLSFEEETFINGVEL